jgi:methionine-rich copper-binding protein CopC
VAVTAGQYGAVVPIAAEQISGGYEVAWKAVGADQYWVWNTDSNGNDTMFHPFNAVPGNTPGLEALEPSFQQDINGDGTIGGSTPPPPATTVIEAFGSTSLVQVGNNYFFYANGTTTGPELKTQGGIPVTVGQFGAVVPIAGEQNASGYVVAWKAVGADQYWIWQVDSGGIDSQAALFSAVPGSTPGLESLEASFQQDINGDGVITSSPPPPPPPATVIEAFGSTSLVQVGNNYFFYANGTTTGPELKTGSVAVTAGQFGAVVPIAAEQITGGYEVVWKAVGGDQYWVWNTDSTGEDTGFHPFTAVPGSTPGLEALEPSFQQDVNGDGTIGTASPPPPPTTVLEMFGSTSLVQVGNNYFLYANGTTTGPELKTGGAVVTAGQFGSVLPIAAEQIAGGYEVAWKAVGADQYWVWNTDSTGNDTQPPLFIAVSGSTPGLEALEPSFEQDINGDGTIGAPASGHSGALVFNASTQISGGASFVVTAKNPIDLPDIDYGADPSLLYTENSTHSGGVLSVNDGAHTDSVSLFGQYTTVGFAMASDNAGGTLVYYPPDDAVVLSPTSSPEKLGTIEPASAPPSTPIVTASLIPSDTSTMAVGAPVTIVPASAPDPTSIVSVLSSTH